MFYIYAHAHTSIYIHACRYIIVCVYIPYINGTQYFSSLFSETFFLSLVKLPVSPKKITHHWATFIPQPQPHADAELVSFIHPCALPTHSLSHQRSQESKAGLLAMKFICLIFLPQIQGLTWMQSLSPLRITALLSGWEGTGKGWVGKQGHGDSPWWHCCSPMSAPIPLSSGCTKPPAGSASTKTIWAKEAYVPLKPCSLIVLLAKGQFHRLDGSDSQRKGRRIFFVSKNRI